MLNRIRALAGGIVRDLGRCFPDLLLFYLVSQAVVVLALSPAAQWAFRQIVASSGRNAIGNFDIIAFLLTPRGLLAGTISAVALFLGVFLVSAGLICIAHAAARGWRLTWAGAARSVIGKARQILGASLLVLVAAGIATLPLVAAAGLVHWQLLSTYDINYYLTTQPSELRIAVAIGGVLFAIALAVAAILYVAAALALPNLLFHGDDARRAFRRSLSTLRSRARSIAGPLLAWPALWWLGSAVVGAIGVLAGRMLVAAAGQELRLLAGVLGFLSLGNVIVAELLGFLLVAVNSLLIVRLHRETRDDPPAAEHGVAIGEPLDERRRWRLSGRPALAVLAIAIGVAAFLGYRMLHEEDPGDRVATTAHRGSSIAAPENTLAAIRRAVDEGADFVEIDVQRTADGVIVVHHDADLMRTAGDRRVITKTTFPDLASVDIASWFGPDASPEPPPMLEEAIEAVRGRSKLVVEIKSYAADGQQLTADVVEMLRAREMVGSAVIMSLEYGEVKEARRLAPEIPVGFVATASIGRLTDLDVDFIAIAAGKASNALIATAHAQDKQVWVWTVDEARAMSRLIDLGVDNVITNVPGRMVDLLAARAALDPLERTLLRLGYLYVD